MKDLASIDRDRQNPWTGVIGSGVGLTLALLLSIRLGKAPGSQSEAVYQPWAWLLGVIAFAVMILWDRFFANGLKEENSGPAAYHRSGDQFWRSVAARYLALCVLLAIPREIYLHFSPFQSVFYGGFRQIVPTLYCFFLLGGVFYIAATLKWRGGVKHDLMDPALHVMLWVRGGAYLFRRKKWLTAWAIWKNRRLKTVFLGFLVEFFFIPFVAASLGNQLYVLARLVTAPLPPTDRIMTHAPYQLAMHAILFIDVLVGLIGYTFPLRWLGNKIRSVDGTILGWASTLACYYPFMIYTSQWLPYGEDWRWQIIHSLRVINGLSLVALGLLAFYVTATLVFGTRFSNLTNRGILVRGPYAWVRHPAYAAKNISWWVQTLPWLGNIHNILYLLGWNAIYLARALTEERHLRKDPAYVAYCKKVKYRFIPGII